MKKLILDYSTWRCGDESNYKLGKGKTALLNEEGFMCCLGQFSLQLNKELKQSDIKGEGELGDLKVSIPLLSTQNDEEHYRSTDLSIAAIDINDDKNTTAEHKIELLKTLFEKSGCEIEVINKPEIIES